MPRELQVLRPGQGPAAAPPAPDVSEDFYDLTEDDLRAISLGAAWGAAASAGGGGVMQTAAMRELTRLQVRMTPSPTAQTLPPPTPEMTPRPTDQTSRVLPT